MKGVFFPLASFMASISIETNLSIVNIFLISIANLESINRSIQVIQDFFFFHFFFHCNFVSENQHQSRLFYLSPMFSTNFHSKSRLHTQLWTESEYADKKLNDSIVIKFLFDSYFFLCLSICFFFFVSKMYFSLSFDRKYGK